MNWLYLLIGICVFLLFAIDRYIQFLEHSNICLRLNSDRFNKLIKDNTDQLIEVVKEPTKQPESVLYVKVDRIEDIIRDYLIFIEEYTLLCDTYLYSCMWSDSYKAKLTDTKFNISIDDK